METKTFSRGQFFVRIEFYGNKDKYSINVQKTIESETLNNKFDTIKSSIGSRANAANLYENDLARILMIFTEDSHGYKVKIMKDYTNKSISNECFITYDRAF